VLALIRDELIYTLFSLVILGVIYLAIAVSKLRERIAKMEGQYGRENSR
jgi:hypothetical protein